MEQLCILAFAMVIGCLLLHAEGLMPQRGGGRTLVFLALLLALGSRCALMDRVPSAEEDTLLDAITWFRGAGGFFGLRSCTAPYAVGVQYFLALSAAVSKGSIYIFKCIEILFDELLAWGCQRCVRAVSGKPRPRLWVFLLVLLLPSGILQSSGGMAQGMRSLWPVLALCAILGGRFGLGGALLGAALAFHPGLLWVLPVYWVFPAVRENTGKTLLSLAGGYLLLLLPALLLGRYGSITFPFWPGIGEYAAREAELGAPGLYALSPTLSRAVGILAYGASAGLVVYRLSGRDAAHDRRRQLCALCFAALSMGAFLPGMSPAVLFFGEALTIALCTLEKTMIPAALCASVASAGALLELLFPGLSPLPLTWAAAVLFLGLLLLLGNVLFQR